jgi:hypothetical protein
MPAGATRLGASLIPPLQRAPAPQGIVKALAVVGSLLADLRQHGALTEPEFEAEKAALLEAARPR